jgi:O-antigen ligase
MTLTREQPARGETLTRLTYRLLLLLVASLPLESVYTIPGSGSVTKFLGLLTGATWALSVLQRGGPRAPHTLHVVALLFVLWNACSLVWTIDGSATQTRVLTYAQLFVLLLVVWDSVTSMTQLRRVLLADVVGCCVGALLLVADYVVLGAAAEVHGRVTVGNFNPNDAGVIFALGLPVACYLLATWRGPGRRLVALLAGTYLPLGTFAVLATGSRAALLAVVPALWYAGRLLWRSRPTLAVVSFVGVGGLAVAALPLLPAAPVQRLWDTGNELMHGNLNHRQDVWAEAFRIIGENPWFGIGAGAFKVAATGVNKVGHNFVLALLAEIGIVGLVLFLAIIVVAVRAIRPAPRALRELWLTILVAWTFAALLHNWEYRKLTWLMFGLMVVSGSLGRESDGSEDPPRATRQHTAGTARRT